MNVKILFSLMYILCTETCTMGVVHFPCGQCKCFFLSEDSVAADCTGEQLMHLPNFSRGVMDYLTVVDMTGTNFCTNNSPTYTENSKISVRCGEGDLPPEVLVSTEEVSITTTPMTTGKVANTSTTAQSMTTEETGTRQETNPSVTTTVTSMTTEETGTRQETNPSVTTTVTSMTTEETGTRQETNPNPSVTTESESSTVTKVELAARTDTTLYTMVISNYACTGLIAIVTISLAVFFVMKLRRRNVNTPLPDTSTIVYHNPLYQWSRRYEEPTDVYEMNTI